MSFSSANAGLNDNLSDAAKWGIFSVPHFDYGEIMNSFLILGLWDSPQEILLILVVVLLLFGSKKLPTMARNLGKTVEEFKRAASNVRNEVMNADIDSTPHQPAQLSATSQPQSLAEHEAEIAGHEMPVEKPAESKAEITLNASPTPPAGTVSQNEEHADKTA